LSWNGAQLWLAVADHCALLPLPVPSAWTWRRDLELPLVEAGEPVLLEGNDAQELAACLASERAACAAAERELSLRTDTSSLASALLEPERARLRRVRARLGA